jgi:CrcB protein
MDHVLFIFIGAGLGGVFRHWVSHGIHQVLSRDFPYGTFVVNISGSFLMGFLFILLLQGLGENTHPLRSFLLIGLLGGYTTFSSFSMDTVLLFQNGAFASALINIFLSVILCILATCIGVFSGKTVHYMLA